MRELYRKGRLLPALERNILKFRALEMVMVLFHIESLKSFVLQSIRVTDKDRIPEGVKKPYSKMWEVLVEERVITAAERDELERLIDYRNQIAHDVESLLGDLSPIGQDYINWRGVKYDYQALKKIRFYREKIERGMNKKYWLIVSPDALLFEAAERTYQQELDSLHKRISRQIAVRKEKHKRLKGQRALDNRRAGN